MSEITDLNQPATVNVPDMACAKDLPAPPASGATLKQCLAYVAHNVPRERWNEVRITAGRGSDRQTFAGEEIAVLASPGTEDPLSRRG